MSPNIPNGNGQNGKSHCTSRYYYVYSHTKNCIFSFKCVCTSFFFFARFLLPQMRSVMQLFSCKFFLKLYCFPTLLWCSGQQKLDWCVHVCEFAFEITDIFVCNELLCVCALVYIIHIPTAVYVLKCVERLTRTARYMRKLNKLQSSSKITNLCEHSIVLFQPFNVHLLQ